MGKPEYEFHAPSGPWRDIGAAGVEEQILSRDPDTGSYTRLLRFEAGSSSVELGTQVHDFWEEVYVVEGDLTDVRLDETFSGGMYACRPPGMRHGPWRSDGGCLLVEFRYGLQRVCAETRV